MLVLSRKVGEKLVIGGNITIVVNRVAGNRVTIGIDAPDEVRIVRGELKPMIEDFRREVHEIPVMALAGVGFDASEVTFETSVPRLAK